MLCTGTRRYNRAKKGALMRPPFSYVPKADWKMHMHTGTFCQIKYGKSYLAVCSNSSVEFEYSNRPMVYCTIAHVSEAIHTKACTQAYL